MQNKILIVDDEKEMLNSLAKILSRKSDYILTLKQNPLEALELLSVEKFDIVITDLKMKEFSGLDILRNVNISSPNTKVIIISGYGTIEASVEAMREGSFDFLEKPFTSEKLFDTISRALRNAVMVPEGNNDNID